MRQRFHMSIGDSDDRPIYWRVEMSGSSEEDPFEDAIDFLKRSSQALKRAKADEEIVEEDT